MSNKHLKPIQAATTAAAKSLQSCPTLCDPIDSSPPGSSVPGILQARILKWVAISFSNAWKWSRSVMSDSSRPHGLQPTRLLCPWIFQARVLEWAAIAFSKNWAGKTYDFERMKVICWKLYHPVIKSCLSAQDCKYLDWKKCHSSDDKLHGLPNYSLKVKFNGIHYLVLKEHD